MKYRLIKRTYASNFTMWIIQKRFFWWWEYVDSKANEVEARALLILLNSGVPYFKEEVQ